MSRPASKKSVEFRLMAPQATRVQLVGEFTHWLGAPIDLKPNGDGLWRTTVALKPGDHAYRFLVDGEWADDPGSPIREPNPFGTENCVCRVP